MLNFIFPSLALFILILVSRSRGKGLGASNFVIYSYVTISLFSFLLYFLSEEYIEVGNSLYKGSLYFSLIVFIYLIPFSLVRDKNIESIRVFSKPTIIIISYITILLSLASITYFFIICLKVFSSGELELFRHLLAANGHPFIEPSFINTLSGIVAISYTVPLFLAFISLALELGRRLTMFLFLSSLSYPVYVFAYFGRDGILFWMMSCVSIYLLMSKYIDSHYNIRIKRYFIIVASAGLSLFMLITISRFGELNNSILSMISYLGQQYLNFCVYFDLNISHTYGARTFTIFHDILFDISYSETLINLRTELASQGREYMSWQWGTMFKDLYTDFGSLGAIILVSLLSLFLFITFSQLSGNGNNMIMILFFLITCQVSFQGIFYFKNYTYAGNMYILLALLLPLFSRFFKYKLEIRAKR